MKESSAVTGSNFSPVPLINASSKRYHDGDRGENVAK